MADVPSQFLRVDSMYPFGILELFGGSAGLTLRLAWTGPVPVHLSREDIVDVHPAGVTRARAVSRSSCVTADPRRKRSVAAGSSSNADG